MTHLAWTERICIWLPHVLEGMDPLVAIVLLSLRRLALPLISPRISPSLHISSSSSGGSLMTGSIQLVTSSQRVLQGRGASLLQVHFRVGILRSHAML